MKITHVLFDMDGLLLDTEKFYTVVQQSILESYGKSFTWELKAKMMGKPAPDAAKLFVQESGLEGILSPAEFLREREAMLDLMFPGSELLPGAEKLITHFHAHGIPMAIATRRNFELKSQQHKELFSTMHHIVVGDDPEVKNGKPSPDIFEVASSRFEEPKPEAASVLVFEDAPSGVAAARAAGMNVVMVPDPNMDKQLCTQAHQILFSLNDFDPVLFGLPAFT